MEFISNKVSIIIPVYKVEKSIERCARSLFEQTYKDIEYVFVDDCSPDNSIQVLKEIIAEYPERKDQVKIIRLEANKGVANARNTGLDSATGEYLIHVDSDDWIEKSMIEELYNKAKQNNSDIVWTDFWVDFPQKTNQSVYRKQNVPDNATNCIIELLSDTLHGGLWNKLIKRNICISNKIHFPVNVNMCEDLVFIIQYLLHANKITYLNKALYHYVQTDGSITIIQNRQSLISVVNAIKILEEILPDKIFGQYLNYYKAKIKRSLFLSGLFSASEYFNCFPESLPIIYNGLNKIDKTAIWLSLHKNFILARVVLFLGRIYSKIVQLKTLK